MAHLHAHLWAVHGSPCRHRPNSPRVAGSQQLSPRARGVCRLQELERGVEASTAEAAALHDGLAGVAEYRAALDVASQQVRGGQIGYGCLAATARWIAVKSRGGRAGSSDKA